jgi:CubicO group peptidase (beta-lactamase class C family)
MSPFLGLLLALTLASSPAARAQAGAIDAVDRYVRSEFARQRIPGLSVAVLRGDSVILDRSYGYVNAEDRTPATDTTAYQVGSISKQFTAAGVLLLVQQGKLRLNDGIIRYLPEGSSVWRGVTIRHLLTHTSGISDRSLDSLDWQKDYSEDELVRLAAAQPLLFKPGASYSYSSTGYTILGAIISRVTGQFYGDFLHDTIFHPLEMRWAGVVSDSSFAANRAVGYYYEHGALKSAEQPSSSMTATADRGLALSTRDLVRWAQGLNHEKPLSRRSLLASWTPVVLSNGWTYPYGFGWQLLQQRGYRRLGHTGARDGFRATFQRYPAFNLTVAVLTNLDEANPEGLAIGIAGMIEPALKAPHLLRKPLSGATPPKPLDQLLSEVASEKESSDVTAGFSASMRHDRRELIGTLLKQRQDWMVLGCEGVASQNIWRMGARVVSICYAKASLRSGEREGNVVFTILYSAAWRTAALDLYFF